MPRALTYVHVLPIIATSCACLGTFFHRPSWAGEINVLFQAIMLFAVAPQSVRAVNGHAMASNNDMLGQIGFTTSRRMPWPQVGTYLLMARILAPNL